MYRAYCRHCGSEFAKSRPDGGRELFCSLLCRWSNKVQVPADVNACWPWTGALAKSGYGVMKVGKRVMTAHRLSLMLQADLPEGLSVLHACDNPCCVNPLHLRAGTVADNNKDIMDRRRHAWDRWNESEKAQWVNKMIAGQKRLKSHLACA